MADLVLRTSDASPEPFDNDLFNELIKSGFEMRGNDRPCFFFWSGCDKTRGLRSSFSIDSLPVMIVSLEHVLLLTRRPRTNLSLIRACSVSGAFIMDKRDHDAILNAYNVAKEQLARKKNDADSAADALQESIVGVIKARARVKNLPGYALRAAHREFKRLINLKRRSEQTAEKEVESHPDVGWEDRVNDRVLIRQLLSNLEARDQILLRLYSEDYQEVLAHRGMTPRAPNRRATLLRRFAKSPG
jgi:hypothetical protein